MSRVPHDLPHVALTRGEAAGVLQTLIDDEIRGLASWGEMATAMSPATVAMCRDVVARRVAALEAARALFAGFIELERAEHLSALAKPEGRA